MIRFTNNLEERRCGKDLPKTRRASGKSGTEPGQDVEEKRIQRTGGKNISKSYSTKKMKEESSGKEHQVGEKRGRGIDRKLKRP